MIWGNDYSTDLIVKLSILLLFLIGYFIHFIIKRHRNKHTKDFKSQKGDDDLKDL